MNIWDTILTSVITVLGTSGPLFLYHHAKIKQVVDVVKQVVEAVDPSANK